MRRKLVALLACLAFATPAAAHRLKLFATVEDGTISGYAFFVGSGRAHGAALSIADATGKPVQDMLTDAQGAFSWKPPAPQTYRLTVNAGDGHVSEATLERSRFGGVPANTTSEESDDATSTQEGVTLSQAQIERAVEAAVARQMRPLLEAYEAAEGRTRFNDIMGGIGMIIGLAGLALWGSNRKKGVS